MTTSGKTRLQCIACIPFPIPSPSTINDTQTIDAIDVLQTIDAIIHIYGSGRNKLGGAREVAYSLACP